MYGLIVLFETILMFLAFACFKCFNIYHINAKNDFLNGFTNKEEYILLPPSFEDSYFSNLVFNFSNALWKCVSKF
jgi:hypothetical protein